MPACGQVRALFVDIGGVLLTNGWDRPAREAAARKFGLDFDDLEERHHLTFDTYEVGKISLDQYLDRIAFFRERPFSRGDFRAFMFAQSRPYPEMIALVRDLKERWGLRVAAVSNEGRELNEHRLRTFRLATFIDCFISSSYVHFRKPDEDIYRVALDVAQVAPGEVVYLEDRPLFVDVARGLGIRGILHTGYASTRRALDDMGLTLAEGDGAAASAGRGSPGTHCHEQGGGG